MLLLMPLLASTLHAMAPPHAAVTSLVTSAADHLFETAVHHASSPTPSPALPSLLRRVFEADYARLRSGPRLVTNLTCMRPADGIDGTRKFDEELLALPLCVGRACVGGVCSDACSRVCWPEFATADEIAAFRACLDWLMVPMEEHPHHNLYLKSCCAAADARTTLTFVRMVERLRRALAHEYGLRLSTLLPRQTFVSRLPAHSIDASRQSLHVDESSFDTFHYSAVLYLSAAGVDFAGGDFAFVDPPDPGDRASGSLEQGTAPTGAAVVGDGVAPSSAAAADGDADALIARAVARGLVLSRIAPHAGLAIGFSSGWENRHLVTPPTAGCRYAMPAFFVTRPDGDEHSIAGGAAAVAHDDAEIADTLWRTALRPESEADFQDFLTQWHRLLAADVG